MSDTAPTILWFRQDLRLSDNPALLAALERKAPVLAVYIWSPEEEGDWAPGGASKWWLHQSLAALGKSLERAGNRLVLRSGPALGVLRSLIVETGAAAVHWNRRYEPAILTRDKAVKTALVKDGIKAESFNAALLFEPWEIETGGKTPYKVYTPFWRACLAKGKIAAPRPAPEKIPAPGKFPESAALESFGLEPRIRWAEGIRAAWTPGEAGAEKELRRFAPAAKDYKDLRNAPAVPGTSRLSPHLHFGEMSPRRAWAECVDETYRKELVWREFAHHLLFHFPHTAVDPLRPEFKKFPWKKNAKLLRAWQKGMTGYPIVDAGMRELWTTGWMHNRVRMIVASFLVKDLFVSWQQGAAWFWDTLVDADLASNTLGWQWTAGCGADAQPFFRVFNPSGQGEKFDAEGIYVKKWCPELAAVPKKWIHRPWDAPAEVLATAGVTLGKNYPKPVVDHAEMRAEALEAFEELTAQKRAGSQSAPGRGTP